MTTSDLAKPAVPEAISFSLHDLQLRLSDGTWITAPLSSFPRLLNATPDQRKNWRWIGQDHEGIHWPDIDEDISTHNLIRQDRKLSDPVYQVPYLIADLFRITDHLGRLFKDRSFTPDGHLMGSIGEVVAKHVYDLTLEPCSTPGIDARAKDGRTVQVKLTGKDGTSFAFSWPGASGTVPDLLLCLKFTGTSFLEVYNGPFPADMLRAKPQQRNGQVRLSINALLKHAGTGLTALAQHNPLSDFNRHFHFEWTATA